LEEALAPPADNLEWNRQAFRDLFVLQPGSRKEDDLGSDNFKIW